jgi:hypothetical protein
LARFCAIFVLDGKLEISVQNENQCSSTKKKKKERKKKEKQ